MQHPFAALRRATMPVVRRLLRRPAEPLACAAGFGPSAVEPLEGRGYVDSLLFNIFQTLTPGLASTLTPAFTTTADNIDTSYANNPVTGDATPFHVQFLGDLTTDADGYYVFRLPAADGAILTIDGQSVILQPSIPGDGNLSGQVNLTDYNNLTANYGMTSGATWAQGDFNNDGAVDFADYNILASHFNQTVSATAIDDMATGGIYLAAGTHSFELDLYQFNNNGGPLAQLQWKTPGASAFSTIDTAHFNPPPVDLTASMDDTASHVNLAWGQAGPGAAAGFNVYRGTTADFVPDASNRIAAGATQPSLQDAVDPDTAPPWLFYKVTTLDGSGDESAPGNVAAVSTGSALTAPINLQVTSTSPNSVTLAWTPVLAASHYTVLRSSTGTAGSFTAVGTVDGTMSWTFGDANLHANRTYFYEVTASDESGTTSDPCDPVSATTEDNAPVATGVQSFPIEPGVSKTLDLSSWMSDADGDGISVDEATLVQPQHGTLQVADDHSVVYTPNAGYLGPDSFTWRATDGVYTSAPATWGLNVEDQLTVGSMTFYAADGFPIHGSLSSQVNGGWGQAVTYHVNGNGPLQFDSSTGDFTYTPSVDTAGPQPAFTFTVTDGTATSNVGSLQFVYPDTPYRAPVYGQTPYDPVLDAAQPLYDSYGHYNSRDFPAAPTVPGQAYTGGTGSLYGRTTPGQDGATVAQVTADAGNPADAGRQVTVNSDGSFTFRPADGFVGTDWITYQVTDGQPPPGLTGTDERYRTFYVRVLQPSITWGQAGAGDSAFVDDPGDPSSGAPSTRLYVGGLPDVIGTSVTLSYARQGSGDVRVYMGDTEILGDGTTSKTWTVGPDLDLLPYLLDVYGAADQSSWADVQFNLSVTLPGNATPATTLSSPPATTQPSPTTAKAAVVTPDNSVLFAFDGTWNEDTSGSNYGPTDIAQFPTDHYAGKAFYFRGVGNRTDHNKLAVYLDGATGLGAAATVQSALDKLAQYYQQSPDARALIAQGKDLALDMIGYSRGCFQAVKFANTIAQSGVPDLSTAQRVQVPEGKRMVYKTVYTHYFHPTLRFMGLISPVGQMNALPIVPWRTDFGWDKTVTSQVQYLEQVMDTHPNDYFYPQTHIAAAGSGTTTHDDTVDATHPEIGYTDDAMNDLIDAACSAGAPVK